ncbi:4-hydroxy-tetrahydrodipicolinate reductase [archaeon]|nr:4-hydroxy-tetrahydrodipicolinate reductase [archaeon]
MIKVAVIGALGRMGSGIIRSVAEQDDMQLVGAIEKDGNVHIGKDVGTLLGLGSIDVALTSDSTLDDTLASMAPDVLVDFTIADVAVESAKIAARNKVNLIIGTTGFSASQVGEIKSAVKDNGVSAVVSPNMATGVNIFFTLARAAASIYEDCDVEIIEAHHRHKKDAPSGTAVRAGELIAEAMGKSLERDGLYGRGKGVIGERGNEIGFHAIRGGDIVGEHTVMYIGDGERIEITHRAHSRQAFVGGTIKAIRFVNKNKRTGKVFSTFDVLGL